ncbi:CCA tRNA nucleotidyltransferase [SAR202 cluster bacterium AC-409-J13_OGT_754m]|nr:CCA tRNA nucleotidyltransferase [SAR202 cluster bacterium AC-409-J13_OGT_754m]
MNEIIYSLREFFVSRSIPAYIVGGYLRDNLLGTEAQDVDVVARCNPMELGMELANRLNGSFITLDKYRGIVRIVTRPSGKVVDLACFNKSIEDYLSGRDFSINAMALNVDKSVSDEWYNYVIDPYNGRHDLRRSHVKMISRNVFTEDPLRLLRAVRIARKLGFAIEAQTECAILHDSSRISDVSSERIREEFMQIIAGNGASDSLRLLDRLGLLSCVMPDLDACRDVSQPNAHYWDVFDHSINTVEAVERVMSGRKQDIFLNNLEYDQDIESYFEQTISDGHSMRTFLKLAALTHDIAKPHTKTTDNKGMHFWGHEQRGSEITEEWLRSLHFSGRGTAAICLMIKHHLRPSQLSEPGSMPTNRAIYRFSRDLEKFAIAVLFLSLADYMAAKGPMINLYDWQKKINLVNHVLCSLRELRFSNIERPITRLVSGNDLMRYLGMKPGPKLGFLLSEIAEANAVNQMANKREALEWAKAKLTVEGEANCSA